MRYVKDMKIRPLLLYGFFCVFIFTSTPIYAGNHSSSSTDSSLKTGSMFKEEKPTPSTKMPPKKNRGKSGKGKGQTAAQKRQAAIQARQAKMDERKRKQQAAIDARKPKA